MLAITCDHQIKAVASDRQRSMTIFSAHDWSATSCTLSGGTPTTWRPKHLFFYTFLFALVTGFWLQAIVTKAIAYQVQATAKLQRIHIRNLVDDLRTVAKDGMEFEERVQGIIEPLQIFIAESCSVNN